MDGSQLGRKVILPATGIDYNYDQLLGKVYLRGTQSASNFFNPNLLLTSAPLSLFASIRFGFHF